MTIDNPELHTSFWKDRRVFVTGATGFIGSWVIKDLLAFGAYVVILVRDPDPQSELYRNQDTLKVSVVHGALEEFWTLERAINENEVDTVIHLGAQSLVGVAQRFPLQTFEANIRGTYNLLEACRLHSSLVKRIVIASSDKAYGEQPDLPYTEAMPLQGHYPYEVSKSCTDLIAQSYWHSFSLPVAIARCGNVYGGGDLNWSRIVPSTVRSLLQGERPVLRSDGSYVRDFIYVKDVAQAYLSLAECIDRDGVKGQAFNFSLESPLTILELVHSIRTQMGYKEIEPVILDHIKGEIHAQHLSAAKAHATLGWQPQFELERGLAETIEWYRAFLRGA